MAYLLDYSATKLNGPTVRAAGYAGAIRYIDDPERLGTKHTSKTEYDSLVAAGLQVLLVFEARTGDADGGFSAGESNALRARAGADMLGYHGPVFFCNDKTTVNVAAWRAYLDGAASVLGIGRVGAYGFANAMDAAVGHASVFWQAGRRSDVRAHVSIWQDNNVQVRVGGITCDRNLILKDIVMEADLTPDQVAELFNRLKWLEQGQRTAVQQLTGNPKGDPAFDANMNPINVDDWGWPSMVDGSKRFAMADYLRLIDLHTCQDNDNGKAVLDAVKSVSANVSLSDPDLAKIATAIIGALPASLAQGIVDEISKRLEAK